MFHVITKFGESIPLVEYIDNADGYWYVGVNFMHFWNGLVNLPEGGRYDVIDYTGATQDSGILSPGHYTFIDVQRLIKLKTRRLLLSGDGRLSMVIKRGHVLRLDPPLAKFMGFDEKTAANPGLSGEVAAIKPMNLTPCRLLNIHFRGAEGNVLNGQPTNIIKSIACPQLKTGDLYQSNYNHPHLLD